MKRTKASEKEKAWRRKNYALLAKGEYSTDINYRMARKKRVMREQLREETKAFAEMLGKKKARKALKEAQ